MQCVLAMCRRTCSTYAAVKGTDAIEFQTASASFARGSHVCYTPSHHIYCSYARNNATDMEKSSDHAELHNVSESGQGVEGDSGVRENYTRVMPWKCYSVNNTLVGVSGPCFRQLRELSSSVSHDTPSIVRRSIVRKRGRENSTGFANITRPPDVLHGSYVGKHWREPRFISTV